MLRVLLALFLAANLIFFGWARGWFAPGWPAPRAGEHEPERLAAQVAPERVIVLAPQAASAAVAAALAPPVCLEAGPFGDAEIGAAEALLAQATLPPGSWAREPGAAPEAAASGPDTARGAGKAVPAPAPAPLWWLRAARADAELQGQLQALPAAALAGGFKACAEPR